MKLESLDFRYLILSVVHYSIKKEEGKWKSCRRKHQWPSLVMVIARVRLAVRVSVRIFPTGRATAGPSTADGSGPSTADGTRPSTRCNGPAPAAIVRGIIVITGFFRPEGLQTDKGRNGEGNERHEDRLFRYDRDGKVSESR